MLLVLAKEHIFTGCKMKWFIIALECRLYLLLEVG
jgi:hypothetical protein